MRTNTHTQLVFELLVFAPLSEIYSRLIIYHVSNVGIIVFSIACAVSPTLDALIVFRFFSGFFGACTLSNGAGSPADMLTPTAGVNTPLSIRWVPCSGRPSTP